MLYTCHNTLHFPMVPSHVGSNCFSSWRNSSRTELISCSKAGTATSGLHWVSIVSKSGNSFHFTKGDCLNDLTSWVTVARDRDRESHGMVARRVDKLELTTPEIVVVVALWRVWVVNVRVADKVRLVLTLGAERRAEAAQRAIGCRLTDRYMLEWKRQVAE